LAVVVVSGGGQVGIVHNKCPLATVCYRILEFTISPLGNMLGTLTVTCHALSIVLELA
jgi:hypothetical protein